MSGVSGLEVGGQTAAAGFIGRQEAAAGVGDEEGLEGGVTFAAFRLSGGGLGLGQGAMEVSLRLAPLCGRRGRTRRLPARGRPGT
jgi:hypothetical protein